MVTLCTTRLSVKKIAPSAHGVFVCFMWISAQGSFPVACFLSLKCCVNRQTSIQICLLGEASPVFLLFFFVNRYLPDDGRCKKPKHVVLLITKRHIRYVWLGLSVNLTLLWVNDWFLDAFTKFRKATITFVMSVTPSVRLSSWKNSAPTGRFIVKFDIGVFLKDLV